MQIYALLGLLIPNAEAGFSTHELTDAAGLVYYIADDAPFSWSTYSASGAMVEANYATSIAGVTTISGGTTSQYLGDSFDGYGPIYVDSNLYYGNGPATLDCKDRQLVFGTQVMGDLSVWRTVYVPDDDTFARTLVFVTNDGAKDISTTVGFRGNLGSDGSTWVRADSSGDASVDLKDNWAVSMQEFYKHSGTSPDPRIGHVWQDGLGEVIADEITLNDGNDTFHWRFSVTVPAGDTIAILTFVTGQPTWAEAQLQAETLVALPDAALECMTTDEIASIVNFSTGPDCSHLDDLCNEGEYDLAIKACVATPTNEGLTCDDGLACTLDDVCGAGTCAGTETAEVTGNGIDEDCEVGEICFSDADDDGHAAEDGSTVVSADADCDDATEATDADPADDCDDTEASAYPGGTEIANDGIDQDCDGADLVEKADDTGGGDDAGGDDAGGDDGGGDDGSGDDDDDDKKGCSSAPGSNPTSLWALALGIVGLVVRRRRV